MFAPAIALAATAIGGIVSAGSAIYQGMAASSQAKYQAAVARNNQQIANQNARTAVQAGEQAAQQNDFRTRALIGQQAAAQGANNLDVNSGSPSQVRQSTAELGRYSSLSIISNANERGYSDIVAGQAQGDQAQADLAAGSNAQIAGGINAAGSFLSSAGSFADKWNTYSQKGLLG